MVLTCTNNVIPTHRQIIDIVYHQAQASSHALMICLPVFTPAVISNIVFCYVETFKTLSLYNVYLVFHTSLFGDQPILVRVL